MASHSVDALGPDFLCVGLQKGGTRTLHDVLSLDTRYWMPLVKEFHHFDRGNIPKRYEKQYKYLKPLEAGGAMLRLENSQRVSKGYREINDLDLQFLRKGQAYIQNGCRDKDYLDLFSLKPERKIAGDITPGYSGLNLQEIQKVRNLLPKAIIVLLLRDPVSRAWSAINMRLRKEVPGHKLWARKRSKQERMLDLLHSQHGQKMIEVELGTPLKSRPSEIYRNWSSVYGEDAIRVFSLDELITSPKGISDEIHAAVTDRNDSGASKWSLTKRLETDPDLVPAPNSKSGSAQVALDAETKAKLVEAYTDEIRECESLFGERVAGWAAKYGI